MAKRPSKRQKIAAKNQKQRRKFFMIVAVCTVLLMALLYVMYTNVAS